MATAETAARAPDKSSRLKPFAWMKRLANIKNSSDRGRASGKRSQNSLKSKVSPSNQNGNLSLPETMPAHKASSNEQTAYDSPSPLPNGSSSSITPASDSNHPQAESTSIAPTLETNPGTIHSEGDHHSKAGTSNTIGGAISLASGGANSIFSSSNHSSHSLTTTLTTIQSAPSSNFLNQNPSQTTSPVPLPPAGQTMSSHNPQLSQGSSYFQHQYPTTPASAVPSHLNPHPHPNVHMPTTYRSATANNLLTDNASVITLASSSNRRARRNSVDTDASIRAIAPSSTWGGSRESLPLSVLSQSTTNEPSAMSAPGPAINTSVASTPQPPSTPSAVAPSSPSQSQPEKKDPSVRPQSNVSGLTAAERGSVYSSGGGGGSSVAAPVLSSERNSIYGKSGTAGSITGTDGGSIKGTQGTDGSSVRSGLVSHGRAESATGSIGGYSSHLVGPKESTIDGENETL